MARSEYIKNLGLYFDIFEAPYYSPLYLTENRRKFVKYALTSGISHECINLLVYCARKLEAEEERQLVLEQRIREMRCD
jgi:hypothetical protein